MKDTLKRKYHFSLKILRQGSEEEISQRNSFNEERNDSHSDGKTNESSQSSDPTNNTNSDTKDDIDSEYNGPKDEKEDIHESEEMPNIGASNIAKTEHGDIEGFGSKKA